MLGQSIFVVIQTFAILTHQCLIFCAGLCLNRRYRNPIQGSLFTFPRRILINSFASDHRHQDLGFTDLIWRNLEQVLRNNDNVCKLSYFDRAFRFLSFRSYGSTHRISLSCLLQSEPLLWKPSPCRGSFRCFTRKRISRAGHGLK